MPELPEVEIAAKLLGEQLQGAVVESTLAPGMVALKSVCLLYTSDAADE